MKRVPVDFPSIDTVDLGLGFQYLQHVQKRFPHEVGPSHDEDFLSLALFELHIVDRKDSR